ncbi:potassium channel protein [Campylobacter sp. Cr9]|uniref:potassium channel family protein n=1 Tax=unclassified Campylobacter TaxID=2593542 RepID=UPI001EFA4102|nr:potassium channel protein [Campylobacter sp. RM5004]MBZ7984977.1 potassium channel protein [Campylobacter sp. Cr9]ULO02265.1 putative potassium channel protein (TrkA domain) [Campylobacter sp. RM5004]
MSFFKKLSKLLGWAESGKPEVDVNTELYEQLRPFRLPLIAVVIMMLLGAIGYMITSNFSLLDGIYQAGMTFTTLGYTEVAEITPAGRFFTICYVLLGFVTFTFSIGIVIEVLKKGELTRLIKEKRMLYKIARLKNHYVICYHNEFTQELAKQFKQTYTPFVVVDDIPDFEKIAEDNKYPFYVKCPPHSDLAFLKTHLSSAKGIISLSPNSADNIAIIASARLYEKDIKRISPYSIITISNSEHDAARLKKLGANTVVLATKLAAQRLSVVSVRPEMENLLEQYLYTRDQSIDIEEVKVPDESWVRFRRLKDVAFRQLANVSVIGIKDANNNFLPMPKGDAMIGTGTKLLLIGTPESIKEVKKIIKNKQSPDNLK